MSCRVACGMPITAAVRVSSCLNGNRKDYGPKNMLDGEEDSCWNSDQVRGNQRVLVSGFSRPLCTLLA